MGALLAGALPLMYAQAPKHEMRGAWVATVYGIDWPSVQGATPEIAEQQKAELTTLIDTLQTAGLNAIFLQVRPMADAIYASDKEPWSMNFSSDLALRQRADFFCVLEYCL